MLIMYKIIKKQGKIVEAYRLGEDNVLFKNLQKENKLLDLHNGKYEVFSQEAVNSESGHGQVAEKEDWIRLDSAGYPYPCTDEWFKENMRHIEGDKYEQIPKPLMAWDCTQHMCQEILFLIEKKGLKIDENSQQKYYSAILWGNPEAAAKNAVIVFYDISYDQDGMIVDAEYNFIERGEFNKTYNII